MNTKSYLYEQIATIVVNLTLIWAICIDTFGIGAPVHIVTPINNNVTVYEHTFKFLSPETFPPRLITTQQIENIL
jgi:hypothetical protein